MKKLILILIILSISIPASASMSKLYVGDENGQFIFGIESTVNNNDSAIGGEVRTYLSKTGLVVDGVEYGSLPGRTKYNFHVAGKNNHSVVRYDHNVYVDHISIYSNKGKPTYENSVVSVKAGQSPYLFYE